MRPSSIIWKFDLHRNKAKLGRFSLALLPCTSVPIQWNVDGADSDDDEAADETRPRKKQRKPRNQLKTKSQAEERLDRQLKRQMDMKRLGLKIRYLKP